MNSKWTFNYSGCSFKLIGQNRVTAVSILLSNSLPEQISMSALPKQGGNFSERSTSKDPDENKVNKTYRKILVDSWKVVVKAFIS